MPARGYPNLARRRRLAAELRRLREHVGLAEDQATERLGWLSNSKLSRIELGKSGVKQRDLQSLLDLYHVTGDRREELIALAEESRRSGQFQSASMRLPGELIAFLEAEADAESIWVWEPLIVPGLLQVENYTRSLLQAWVDRFSLPSGEVDRRVEARRIRQEVLTRDPPVRLSAVIDESVLYRRIGDAVVMREQLNRLVTLSESPHIEVRILPLNGEHLVGTGSFNYLRFRQLHAVPLDDFVAFEHLTGMDEVEDESDVHQYKAVFESLTSNALCSDETRARITAVANETWALSLRAGGPLWVPAARNRTPCCRLLIGRDLSSVRESICLRTTSWVRAGSGDRTRCRGPRPGAHHRPGFVGLAAPAPIYQFIALTETVSHSPCCKRAGWRVSQECLVMYLSTSAASALSA